MKFTRNLVFKVWKAVISTSPELPTYMVLILTALQGERLSGYQLLKKIRESGSPEFLENMEGKLYPILYQLEKEDYISSETIREELGRSVKGKIYRKYYFLTSSGEAYLKNRA
jgi:DNA-binding PadR family transcriptional regulator